MSPSRRPLFAIAGGAFLLRLATGLLGGPGFVEHGYAFYAEIARTFLDGHGLCAAPGIDCAVRVPLYPLLAAPFLATGTAYPWLVVFQSLVGASIPLVAYALGARLFNARVGLVAALAAAINPYAVVHGSRFQDTEVFNALLALGLWWLIKAADSGKAAHSVAAGIVLALATLTAVRMAAFVPLAVVWLVAAGRNRTPRARIVQGALVTLPIVVLLGGWIARNASVVGAPVLTTEAGLSLWLANNDMTMTFLPGRSIDEVEAEAWPRLVPGQREAIESLASDPAAQDRAFARIGLDYMRQHPGQTLATSAQKVFFGVSGWLSPARSWPVQLGYAAVFVPINILAMIGLWRARHAGPTHGLVLLLLAAFVVTTAVFWAHTSHQSFLHPLAFVYAGSLIARVRTVG